MFSFMKILIVDDARVMRSINRNILVDHGIDESCILEAADGNLAMTMAEAETMDLILLDWNMPGLDGLSFVKKIRTRSEYASTPIVMITSEAARYNVLEAVEAGVSNYVVKPVKPDVLWSRIREYLPAELVK